MAEEILTEFTIELNYAGTQWLRGTIVGKEEASLATLTSWATNLLKKYTLAVNQEFTLKLKRTA